MDSGAGGRCDADRGLQRRWIGRVRADRAEHVRDGRSDEHADRILSVRQRDDDAHRLGRGHDVWN